MFKPIDNETTPANDESDVPADRRIPLDTDDRTLVLAGCGKSKTDTQVPAKDLYTSGYFSLKRTHGEYADKWRIISAEHGLLHPETVVAPYETEWSDLSDKEEAELVDSIVANLQPLLEDIDTIIFLAGKNYRYPVIEALDHDDVVIVEPFEQTIGFNDQMKFMSNEADRLLGENR
jgi:hypothetical protein